MRRWLICFFAVVCSACTRKPDLQHPVATVLDSNKVSFKGAILDHDALLQLQQATLSHEEWINVLPVIGTPTGSDPDTEVQLTGKYAVNDTSIIFTADRPFVKNVNYVAHFHSSDQGLSYLKMAQAKENLKGPGSIEFKFKVN